MQDTIPVLHLPQAAGRGAADEAQLEVAVLALAAPLEPRVQAQRLATGGRHAQ
jgi:hypothetical protein